MGLQSASGVGEKRDVATHKKIGTKDDRQTEPKARHFFDNRLRARFEPAIVTSGANFTGTRTKTGADSR
jgi:hypothetical protein